MKDFGKYKKIGQTRDDASGEAFDKVARMLDLPYPGGPEISKLAEKERKEGYTFEKVYFSGLFEEKIKLPRPMIHSKDFDFSFSGLKTAVLYLIRDLKKKLNDDIKQKIAKEFEDAVVDVLTFKTFKAVDKHKIKSLIIGGGVSANRHLQNNFKNKIKKEKIDIDLFLPTKKLSTDNALMISIVGYFNYKNKKRHPLKAKGGLSF